MKRFRYYGLATVEVETIVVANSKEEADAIAAARSVNTAGVRDSWSPRDDLPGYTVGEFGVAEEGFTGGEADPS